MLLAPLSQPSPLECLVTQCVQAHSLALALAVPEWPHTYGTGAFSSSSIPSSVQPETPKRAREIQTERNPWVRVDCSGGERAIWLLKCQVLQDSSLISNRELTEVSPEALYWGCLLSRSYFNPFFPMATHEPFQAVTPCASTISLLFPMFPRGCWVHQRGPELVRKLSVWITTYSLCQLCLFKKLIGRTEHSREHTGVQKQLFHPSLFLWSQLGKK